MLARVILFFALIIITWAAIRCKLHIRRVRQREAEQPEDIPSPISRALTELVGTAGGIYLSLTMLVTFLALDIPERISIYDVTIDPLALISIGLTLIQPVLLRIWYYIITPLTPE